MPLSRGLKLATLQATMRGTGDRTFSNAYGQRVGAPVLDFRGSAFPKAIQLDGKYMRLRPLDPNADAAALLEALGGGDEPERWTYLPFGPLDTIDAVMQWLREQCSEHDGQAYTIRTGGSAPRGLVGYCRVRPQRGTLEIVPMQLTKVLRRTRVGTEALFLLLRQAFDELGYRRVAFRCDALDARAQRWAARLGFQFEGVLRNSGFYKGRNCDTAQLSVINDDWPDLCRAFDTWLRPENFDTQGSQRESLSLMTSKREPEEPPPATQRHWETS